MLIKNAEPPTWQSSQIGYRSSIDAMASAVAGSACVVSAFNGLHEVMIDRQGVLLDAAVKAGVSRFISSNFAADAT